MSAKRDPIGDFLAGLLGEVRPDVEAARSAIADLPRTAGAAVARAARERLGRALDRAADAARSTPKGSDVRTPTAERAGLSGFSWRK